MITRNNNTNNSNNNTQARAAASCSLRTTPQRSWPSSGCRAPRRAPDLGAPHRQIYYSPIIIIIMVIIAIDISITTIGF